MVEGYGDKLGIGRLAESLGPMLLATLPVASMPNSFLSRLARWFDIELDKLTKAPPLAIICKELAR